MEKQEYWHTIRELAQQDDSVAPPDHTVEMAMSIFQPKKSAMKIFKLQPSFAGMVRRAGSGTRLVYELEDQFVKMEHFDDENGVSLSGFASGLEDTAVTLFGDESVYRAEIADGEFEFKSIPGGCYDMAFDCKGESLWIPKLILGDTKN